MTANEVAEKSVERRKIKPENVRFRPTVERVVAYLQWRECNSPNLQHVRAYCAAAARFGLGMNPKRVLLIKDVVARLERMAALSGDPTRAEGYAKAARRFADGRWKAHPQAFERLRP